MNILIIAGGTGSIALQTGLYSLIGEQLDGITTKVLVNAYDNGLSTGTVRKVMGGKILGPSDVRKNQTTRLKLEQPNSVWHKLLDIRFTEESSKAKEFCLKQVKDILAPVDAKAAILVNEAIDEYFSVPLSANVDYSDFSLANIVYAGFAKANQYSLRKAASIMAQLMGIQDNVILNSDESLFLGAVSKKGITVTDEGDIVSWGKVDDPFQSIFFYDSKGDLKTPVLCEEAKDAIADADLIILSSGTQWSSLIPTYESKGFANAIAKSKARIVMVMNRMPDKDSPGQGAGDIVDLIVPKYFPSKTIRLLVDSTSPAIMREVSDASKALLAWVESADMHPEKWGLGDVSETKHNPQSLAKAVLRTAYREYIARKSFMFDYDDTLVGRSGKFGKSSAFNMLALRLLQASIGKDKIHICTGNGVKAVKFPRHDSHSSVWQLGDMFTDARTYLNTIPRDFAVFADGGVNLYAVNTATANINSMIDEIYVPEFVKCIAPEYLLTANANVPSADALKRVLIQNGIPVEKIENRGDVMVSIKPIDEVYRNMVLSLTRLITEDLGLIARATGRTTIDITRPGLSKVPAVKYVLDNSDSKVTMTYVGDEVISGNDQPVAEMNDHRVKCFNTSGPAETALLLIATLSHILDYDTEES